MHWTIKRKLMGCALLGAALAALVGLGGYLSVVEVAGELDASAKNSRALRLQGNADMMHDALRADVLFALTSGREQDAGKRGAALTDLREHTEIFRKSLLELEEIDLSAEVRQEITKAKPVLERYIATAQELAALAFAENERALQKYPEFQTSFEELEVAMERTSTLIEKSTAASKASGEATVAMVSMLIIIVCALAAALLLGASYAVVLSIVRPLGKAVEVANRIAQGNLDNKIATGGTDEVGALLGALRAMNGSLRSIVHEVRQGARTVADSATEIARGNADLSSRTEEQASSLEETSSSMEELTATVKQNADGASQASRLAGSASEVAVRGGEEMAQVARIMGDISGASKRIADITGVIDGIAFQTNILALNAAVEAARAGEQGRGFAVVASEVRGLAQRAAAAAKEIGGLIGSSVERVGTGAQLIDGAGKTMGEIVASIKRVSDVMSGIAAASREQLSGIEEVSRAVTQVEQVVQQNAAQVEESAAAAENLQGQAGAQVELVARFRLGESDESAAAPRAAAAASRRTAPSRPALVRLAAAA